MAHLRTVAGGDLLLAAYGLARDAVRATRAERKQAAAVQVRASLPLTSAALPGGGASLCLCHVAVPGCAARLGRAVVPMDAPGRPADTCGLLTSRPSLCSTALAPTPTLTLTRSAFRPPLCRRPCLFRRPWSTLRLRPSAASASSSARRRASGARSRTCAAAARRDSWPRTRSHGAAPESDGTPASAGTVVDQAAARGSRAVCLSGNAAAGRTRIYAGFGVGRLLLFVVPYSERSCSAV